MIGRVIGRSTEAGTIEAGRGRVVVDGPGRPTMGAARRVRLVVACGSTSGHGATLSYTCPLIRWQRQVDVLV